MLTHLTLYTTAPQRLQAFYAQTLGFATQPTDHGFHVQIGHSILEWRRAAASVPYHFAINIPANQLPQALAWTQARVAVLPYNGQPTVPFEAWNAEALYFYDPDHNIVEFIARRNTQPSAVGDFGASQCLGLSEIGAPTSGVPAAIQQLTEVFGLPLYSRIGEAFAAVGDEEGLFIVVNGQRPWLPTQDAALPAPFEATVQLAGQTHPLRYDAQTWSRH